MTETDKHNIATSFPAKYETNQLDIEISTSEFKTFEDGIFSRSMEERWNVFVLRDIIYLARSWTNFCIYKVFIKRLAKNVILSNFQVNRNDDQYKSSDIDYDTVLLKELLQMFLQREADFYSDPKLGLPLMKKALSPPPPSPIWPLRPSLNFFAHGTSNNLTLRIVAALNEEPIPVHPADEFIVLLTTGSMCPTHPDHVSMMLDATNYINLNIPRKTVVAGLMSPTHDGYVTSKMARSNLTSLDGTHRFLMLYHTIHDNPAAVAAGVIASRAEIDADKFYDFPVVTSTLRKQLQTILTASHQSHRTKLNADRVKVYYVCGLDHAENIVGGMDKVQMWTDGLVVVARTPDHKCPADLEGSCVFVPTTRALALSSTMVRAKMMSGELETDPERDSYMSPSTFAYIKKNRMAFETLHK